MNAKRFFYPETSVGGYSRVDGTIEFYGRVNALIEPDMVIADFGAGRGKGPAEDTVPYRRALQNLRGKCAKVIGIDVDRAVLENNHVDEAILITPDERLPLLDESVDIIVSDAVFEHVQHPEVTCGELARILKPGGWLCVRTPNRWGYIGVGTNLVPNRYHDAWLRVLQPQKQERDTFPTTYKLNTKRALRKYFPPSLFAHYVYGYFAEPAYFSNWKVAWAIMLAVFRITPEPFAPIWMCFLRKNG
jgi:SAM-dependent methyltransferase